MTTNAQNRPDGQGGSTSDAWNKGASTGAPDTDDVFDDDLLALTESMLGPAQVQVQAAVSDTLKTTGQHLDRQTDKDVAQALAPKQPAPSAETVSAPAQAAATGAKAPTEIAATEAPTVIPIGAATSAAPPSVAPQPVPQEPDQTSVLNEIEAARKKLRQKLRRRGRRVFALFLVTVIAPVAAAYFYLTEYVTPLFETRSVIAISQPGNDAAPASAGVLGALGGGAGLSQTFMADEYVRSEALIYDLQSAENQARLAAAGVDPNDLGTPMFGVTSIDSSIDIQAGLMTIYVRMADPDQAAALSTVVIDLIAQHVNSLGDQLSEQRLGVAQQSVNEAQAKLQDARFQLIQLQVLTGDVDPAQRVAAVYARIAEIEQEIAGLEAQIGRLEVGGEDGSYEVQRLQILIERLTEQADEARQSLVRMSDGGVSLNQQLMDFELARQNVKIAEETLTSALTAMSVAQSEVALERSVMQVVVPVLIPQTPKYPKLFAALLVVALIGSAVFFTLRSALMSAD